MFGPFLISRISAGMLFHLYCDRLKEGFRLTQLISGNA